MNQLFLVIAIVGIALVIVAVGSPLFTANANVAGGSINTRAAAPVAVAAATRAPNPIATLPSGPRLETLTGRSATVPVSEWIAQATNPSYSSGPRMENLVAAKNAISISGWMVGVQPQTKSDLAKGLGLPPSGEISVSSFFSGQN
jgi:hypothetical protein